MRLAIDDFGTGWSSLAYLKWLPFDVLKVDRSFVRNLGEDPRDEAIIATIVTLARQLDKTVVAEGVESDRQLQALRRLGCQEAQGFLLGRPARAGGHSSACWRREPVVGGRGRPGVACSRRIERRAGGAGHGCQGRMHLADTRRRRRGDRPRRGRAAGLPCDRRRDHPAGRREGRPQTRARRPDRAASVADPPPDLVDRLRRALRGSGPGILRRLSRGRACRRPDP